MGELSPRLASLAVSSAMVVRIRRMTDPKCAKKKKKERRLSPSLRVCPANRVGVGEDSRRREATRDSFVRGDGRNEAII